MKSGKICLTPSEIWKCILNPIPLHYLNSKGEINSGCCFFFPCASNFNRLLLWTATGRAFSVTEGLVQAIAPLFFSKHLLDDELLLGKSRTFDLLRKPSIVCFKNAPRLPVSPVEALNIWWPFIYFQSFQIPSHSCDLGQGKRAAPEWPLLSIHYPIDLY